MQPEKESIQQILNLNFFHKVDLQNSRNYLLKLVEHKIFLQDDVLNLMGLSEPREVSYFNFDTDMKVLPVFPAKAKGEISVSITLSRKVFI